MTAMPFFDSSKPLSSSKYPFCSRRWTSFSVLCPRLTTSANPPMVKPGRAYAHSKILSLRLFILLCNRQSTVLGIAFQTLDAVWLNIANTTTLGAKVHKDRAAHASLTVVNTDGSEAVPRPTEPLRQSVIETAVDCCRARLLTDFRSCWGHLADCRLGVRRHALRRRTSLHRLGFLGVCSCCSPSVVGQREFADRQRPL